MRVLLVTHHFWPENFIINDLAVNLSKSYKNKILNETKNKISIEAGSSDCWKKYVGENGKNFGINEFGKSAPFKEIYKFFGLTKENITSKSKKFINN